MRPCNLGLEPNSHGSIVKNVKKECVSGFESERGMDCFILGKKGRKKQVAVFLLAEACKNGPKR